MDVGNVLEGCGKKLSDKEFQQDSPTLKPTGETIDKTDYPQTTFPKNEWDVLSKRNGVKLDYELQFKIFSIDTAGEKTEVKSFYWNLKGPLTNPKIETDLPSKK